MKIKVKRRLQMKHDTKILFAVLIACIVVIGFISQNRIDAQEKEAATIHTPKEMWVTDYDGCEYIVWQYRTQTGSWISYHRGMTHKGNCMYCQQRLKEAIKK